MNTKEVRNTSTFKIWHGDKESYWLSTELMGVPYSFETWYAARMCQSQEIGIQLFLDDDDEWKKQHPEPLKEPQNVFNHTGSPPPERSSCTLHIAHSDAWGTEPLWANSALWYNKGNKQHGISNWTHWYLGEPVHAVLGAYSDQNSDGSGDDKDDTAKEQQGVERKIWPPSPSGYSWIDPSITRHVSGGICLGGGICLLISGIGWRE
ncbi:uncharacterized protein Z519_09596 [Cladophialophora bantiana CBS 173.52]|uniref:Uncharacterized protein n=1 Tax=Cladophialophora bantiana (strain ATCC 10958 / CBS 173.52 / CDC B-1940 / NIH 8579) TaxID=1442370 RepID=A0A0D2HFA5_CLAB1|nr:uncharacterized protein Z519_09596 [Cladophialophora bantiana CBS 173.52]KIW89440.1 hypothetical protein Z519_09596 [Cladophialophora bantiana CBS 173.52]